MDDYASRRRGGNVAFRTLDMPTGSDVIIFFADQQKIDKRVNLGSCSDQYFSARRSFYSGICYRIRVGRAGG